MTSNFSNVIDITLNRLKTGESIPTIVADYPAEAEALASLLETATTLEVIRPVEMPAPEVWHADRTEFLAHIADFQQQPVSVTPLIRLKEWIVHILPQFSLYPWKEQRRMSTLLIKTMIVFGMIFGSVGGTTVLAANSLPDSPLYPLKLTLEQTRLALTADPANQAHLHLALAAVRTREMTQLALKGNVPDEANLQRLQQHLNQAFNTAAQLPDEAMRGLLSQARQMLQNQEQLLAQTQGQVSQPVQQTLQEANQFLHQARQQAETGLKDPQIFRQQFGQGGPVDAPAGPCDTDDCEPAQNQNQHQHQNQNQNGPMEDPPGPCDTDDCEPAQNQNQHQHQNQNQNGPMEDPPGPCNTDDCEPAQNQNQNQHQHQNQNQNGPMEDPPGPCNTDDCEPVGDQNQYRYQNESPGPHGDPNCVGDCDPIGDQNQYQHQHQNQNGPPSEPSPGPQPPSEPSGPGGNNNQNGGNDDNGGNDQDNDNGQNNDNGGGDDNGGGNDNGGGDNDNGGNGNNGGGGDGQGGGNGGSGGGR